MIRTEAVMREGYIDSDKDGLKDIYEKFIKVNPKDGKEIITQILEAMGERNGVKK